MFYNYAKGDMQRVRLIVWINLSLLPLSLHLFYMVHRQHNDFFTTFFFWREGGWFFHREAKPGWGSESAET